MARRLAHLGLLACSAALVACGSAPPPAVTSSPAPSPGAEPAPLSIVVAPAGAPSSTEPTLFVIRDAEASARRAPEAPAPAIERLRSQGKRHAILRTADGLAVLSHDRGVLGILRAPSGAKQIHWAGFVEEDAVVIAEGGAIHRAETPDEALLGKFQSLGPIDPAATRLASGGKVVVALVPEAGGAVYESRDGGRQFTTAKRPAPDAIAAVEVRSDGVIVAAAEKERFSNERGTRGLRADIYVSQRPGRWEKGPTAEALTQPVIMHLGDSVLVRSSSTDPRPSTLLGLDAKGRWIRADYPGEWLTKTWLNPSIEIGTPEVRPGFPRPTRGEAGGVASGLLGALGTAQECVGAECLRLRTPVGAQPTWRAFQDGVCARQHVVSRTEKLHGSTRGEVYTYHECDPDAPAQRASTLLFRSAGAPAVKRLPISCADGRIFGAGDSALIHCTAKHRGRPSIQHLSPGGALMEVAQLDPDVHISGAEAASDGTAVLSSKKGAWVCRTTNAPSCAAIPHDGLLAARPLPGGRALVARRGASAASLVLEIFGEPTRASVDVRVAGNVLEMEVTPRGNVRLWTSATERRLPWGGLDALTGARPPEALLVRTDGVLVPDTAASANTSDGHH